MESDQYMPEYWPANRIIGKLEKALVKAENILGLIQSEQIANLAAAKVTGLLTSAQIEEIEAAKVSGQLTNAQIKELEAAKITGELTSAQIKSLEASKITGEISETQIGPESVSTPKLKANAVTAVKIAAEAVTAEKIAALTITAGKIAANAITSEKIAALAITAGKIAAEAITAEKIAAATITGAKIAAGTITAEKLSVATLSAITANLGTVTAGTLKAVTIESAKLKFETKEVVESPQTLEWGREAGAETAIGRFTTLGFHLFGTAEMLQEVEIAEAKKATLRIHVKPNLPGEKETAGLHFKYKTYPEILIFGDRRSALGGIGLQQEASNFLQLPEPSRLKILWGRVEVNGAATILESSGGFTVTRIAAGQIKVTLTTESAITPIVNATPQKEGEGRFTQLVFVNKKEFQVNLSTVGGGTANGIVHLHILTR